MLFSGDVKGNLDFGRSQETPLSERLCGRPWNWLSLRTLSKTREAGLESEVAQGGNQLLRWTKDNVWPLRALARKQKSSSLMTPSQPWITRQIVSLRQELAEKTKSMTKLIVAQRISTIMDADLILVLDQR